MQPRKFLTVERSAQKQYQRVSYQPNVNRETYDTNFQGELSRYGSNTSLLKTKNEMKFSQLHRSPSEVGFKTREDYTKGNLARRRGDGMVSNLKSQLQNLKMEVSKLMNKETDGKMYSSRKISSSRAQQSDFESQRDHSLVGYGKDLSDTISVTSQKIIDEPLRRLQSKFNSANYDHGHYMQLQNDLLKTELRNLKNKYNATKQDLKQKCDALIKKNEYLEVSLRRSQQALTECKRSLEMQVQTIKFQLTRKIQQQYEQDQKKYDRLNQQPVRDTFDSNELIQQKLNKLYQQLNEKTKMLSQNNLDLNQAKGLLQKKTFEFKKQVEKNSQLMKQLQFSKRENSRNTSMLEIEVSKKTQLNKIIENLRQKNNEISKELHLQNQIVNSSQQLQGKYSREVQQLKENQQKLSEENFELNCQLRKYKQLCDSHEQQIKHLKLTISDFSSQVEQLSKNLRNERQKIVQSQEHYRKLLDQTKQSGQKQLQILSEEFQKYKQNAKQIVHEHYEESIKSKQGYNLKQKDRQISKWKAQYKMLKLKFDEHFSRETNSKDQIQSYYRNYKEYKSKNKILTMRNKVLQESAAQYIEKIQTIEAANLQERVKNLQKMNKIILQNQQTLRKSQYLQQQLNQLRSLVQNEIQRANQEQNFRKEIQNRVLNLDIENNDQLMQIIQKMKKRMNDQDDKINKYIKEMKTKENLIKQLKKQIRTILQNQQKQLQKFKSKQLANTLQQIISNNFVSLEQLKNQAKKQINIETNVNNELLQQNTKMKAQITLLTKDIIQSKEEIKIFTHLYNSKILEFDQMQHQQQLQHSNLANQTDYIEKMKNQNIQNLQSEINSKNQQIQNYRAQIKNLLTMKTKNQDEPFDQALKSQIQTSKKLREQLNKKNEQVYRIRDSYAALKTELDNLKSQTDISKLKFISDKKNLQVQFEVQTQTTKSQLNQQQKKVSSLQQKIKLVIDQNKKKDTFIQTYIMAKKLPTNQKQILTAFLKQYQICLSGKQINEKLNSQSQQLQKMASYNFCLMKEIAQMKQKLLLYEAVSIDNFQPRSYEDLQSPKNKLMKSQSVEREESYQNY